MEMTIARRSDAWQRCSMICALLANIHRDSKKHPRPYEPDDFNPLSVKEQRKMGILKLEDLRPRKRKGIPLTDITMLKALIPQRGM